MSLRAYPKFQSVGRGRLCPYWPALGMALLLAVATGVEGKSLSGIHQEFLKTKLEAVKSMGLNPDTYQRRIYDTFVTRRWLDGNTIEADARSVSSVLIKEKDGENSEDVIASFRCIVKWNSKTKTWTIPKTKKLKEN